MLNVLFQAVDSTNFCFTKSKWMAIYACNVHQLSYNLDMHQFLSIGKLKLAKKMLKCLINSMSLSISFFQFSVIVPL